jgi:hypothetical protein
LGDIEGVNYQWRADLDVMNAWNYNLQNIDESNPSFSYWYESQYGMGTDYARDIYAFNSFMPNVPSLDSSFANCIYLQSWNCPTPNCNSFRYTFNNCVELKHWRGDLSNASDCYGMFGTGAYECAQLDLASVQHIAQVIGYGSGQYITLGVAYSLNGSAELEQALNELYNKGWQVEVIYSYNG